MTVHLTSDTHARHRNIIKYSGRPFASVEEMDLQLIANINKHVKKDDTLYHLGDVANYDLEGFMGAINCKNVILIEGNHDRIKSHQRKLFAGIYAMYTLKFVIDGEEKETHLCHYPLKNEVVMCHYAMRVWNKSHHGVYHAYGHSHASLPEDPNSRSMDVGVDSIARKLSVDGVTLNPEDYRPITLREFHDYMKVKEWKPIDHHRGNHVDSSFETE